MNLCLINKNRYQTPILDVGIVRLKTYNRNQKVKELFDMFKLPIVDYTNGYQVAPTTKPTLVGAATLPTNEQKTKELFEMFGLRL